MVGVAPENVEFTVMMADGRRPYTVAMLHGHGPMFESELVAYRVYFNQKQTVDPNGKLKKDWKSRKAVFIPMTNSLHAVSETMY